MTVDDEVPVELRRLWRITTGSGLGRPADLDVERVVQAAIELADRYGLPGATMPKIAESLGVTTMALYRHVGSKAELLDLIADAAFGPPPDITSAPQDWRTGLREWAHAGRSAYRRRPWLTRIPLSGLPAGPNQISWMETALRVLRGAGLDPDAKLGVITLISAFVRATSELFHSLERGWSRAGLDQASAQQRYGRSLATLVTPDRFPEMAAILASGIFENPPEPPDPGDPTELDFVFGLERILDGIATSSRPLGDRPVE